MAIFKKPAIKAQNRKKRDIPHGLFQKCPGCSEVVPEIELAQNLRVCPRCDYHFSQSAKNGSTIFSIRKVSWRWMPA